jgi:threonine/homoserine/homoserine lactone efflux protein
VAISPIPIIAVILMLLAPKAGGTSTGFLVGWLLGIAGATTVLLLLAGVLDLGSSSQPSAASSWIKLVLGALLIVLAAGQWRSRPEPGAEPAMPEWMTAIDQFTAGKALGPGVLVSTVNPKNLLMCVAVGTTIAAGGLGVGGVVGSVTISTVLAASTVAVPVVGYAVGRTRMAGPLESLRGWLTTHSAAVMATLLLVIGVVLLGKGWADCCEPAAGGSARVRLVAQLRDHLAACRPGGHTASESGQGPSRVSPERPLMRSVGLTGFEPATP